MDDAPIVPWQAWPRTRGVGGWGRPGPANRGLVGDHRPVCNFVLVWTVWPLGLHLPPPAPAEPKVPRSVRKRRVGRCHYIMPETFRQRGNGVVTNKTFWSVQLGTLCALRSGDQRAMGSFCRYTTRGRSFLPVPSDREEGGNTSLRVNLMFRNSRITRCCRDHARSALATVQHVDVYL